MTGMAADRTLPWDWYPGDGPGERDHRRLAYVETTFSFVLFRSERADGVTIGPGASTYLGTMFDVGRDGRVTLGDYALVHGARIICDAEVTIEDYALISWNVVLMDSYRVPLDPDARRDAVRRVPLARAAAYRPGVAARRFASAAPPGSGSTAASCRASRIGEGAVVGARSVVTADVEPFTIVAGNPARLVRRLTDEEIADGC